MNANQDHEPFERLFLPMQTTLRGYLFAATRDWTETDDLFQEVATVLWRKFGEFDRTRSFPAWAMGVARLQVLRRRQSFARSRLIFSEEAIAALADLAGNEPEREDVRLAHLHTCLGKLQARARSVIAMRFEQKQSLAEIGSHLQKSAEATAMLLMRIRQQLRDCVEKTMLPEKGGAQ